MLVPREAGKSQPCSPGGGQAESPAAQGPGQLGPMMEKPRPKWQLPHRVLVSAATAAEERGEGKGRAVADQHRAGGDGCARGATAVSGLLRGRPAALICRSLVLIVEKSRGSPSPCGTPFPTLPWEGICSVRGAPVQWGFGEDRVKMRSEASYPIPLLRNLKLIFYQ